jgi:tripartite-type tricarboxylate transporter receptor subunit TctC
VALIAEQPLLLAARKDFPANNLQEFIAAAKAKDANLQFASGGTGSATHLGCVLLNSVIVASATHVPYRSTAIALQDMIGGRIDYACPIASTALSQVASGQVKGIAMLSKNRSPALPNLPSAHEQGLANFEA